MFQDEVIFLQKLIFHERIVMWMEVVIDNKNDPQPRFSSNSRIEHHSTSNYPERPVRCNPFLLTLLFQADLCALTTR